MFKHDIYGDQQEVLDGMHDSSNFLPPKFFESPSSSPIPASSEDAAVGVHRREVEEELERSAPVRDLMEHPKFHFSLTFSFFCNGPIVDIYHYVTNDSVGIFMRYNFWYSLYKRLLFILHFFLRIPTRILFSPAESLYFFNWGKFMFPIG